MAEHFISCKNVCFNYEGRSDAALKNISLNIDKGELVAVLGHNGSGKSTLAKHLNGILTAQSGDVEVAGFNTKDEDNIFNLRSRVGMVFQNPDNQLVATIVEEDVAFALENLGVEPKEIRKRVDEALEAVGMSEFKLSQPHKLSGGQKQRVAIAGVLAMSPDCIVLDEPTAMLDPKGRAQVMDTIIKLNRERGITGVLVTHFMEEAALCDRIVVMNDGEVFLDGEPKEVFKHAQKLKDVGLAVPDVTSLCNSLQKLGVEIETSINKDEFIENIQKLLIG